MAQVLTSTWSIAQLFAPWMPIIVTKLGDEEVQYRAAVAVSKWANSENEGSFEEIAQIGAELEDKLWEAVIKQRAFEGRGTEQQRFVDAADYSDAWAPDVKVWYICRCNQGAGWGCCNTLIESKEWDRFHADPLATGQRWYCGNCAGKCRLKYGLLLEVKMAGVLHYLLADSPSNHVKDIKGMMLEDQLGKTCQTAEELYERIPGIRPASTVFFEPIEQGWATHKKLVGHYRITNMDHLESLPKWDWGILYKLPAVIASGSAGKAVQDSKAIGGRIKYITRPHVPYDLTPSHWCTPRTSRGCEA